MNSPHDQASTNSTRQTGAETLARSATLRQGYGAAATEADRFGRWQVNAGPRRANGTTTERAERGRVGERYLLGGRNMTLKELLDALARYPVSARREFVCRGAWRWPLDTPISSPPVCAAASRGSRSRVSEWLATRCGRIARRRSVSSDSSRIGGGRAATCRPMYRHHGYVSGERSGIGQVRRRSESAPDARSPTRFS